jgi:two-component system response regulator FixJ
MRIPLAERMDLRMEDRRVYIIEDERLLRGLIRHAIVGCCTHVEEFDSSESFLAGHADRLPGCIVVDIGLPGMDGLDLLEAISMGRAAYPVIVVSANANLTHGLRAGRLGVVDFIEKPFRVERLMAAVRMAFAQLRSGKLSGVLALGALTPREKEVLVSYADGAPNKVVAYSLGLSVRTVELHRANMMRKLGVRSLSQALLIAKDGGYV